MEGEVAVAEAEEAEEVEQVQEEEDEEEEAEVVPFSVSTVLQNRFSQHHDSLVERRKLKRQKLQIRPFFVAEAEAARETVGADQGDCDNASVAAQKKPEAEFEGDEILAKLQSLLATIDERGYQRSRQQLMFHDAFIRATSRVIYRKDWSTSRPVIMSKNNWTKCSSEILISTPRRFGKTFR
jgi:hypothetical protein